jgi:hypothetical protein
MGNCGKSAAQWAAMCLFVLAVTAGFANIGHADGLQGQFAVSAQIGRIVPQGTFAAERDGLPLGSATPGIGVAFDIEYYALENLSAGLKVHYNYFGQDAEYFRELFPSIYFNGHWSERGVHAYLKYIFAVRSQSRYYLRGGITVGRITGKIEATAGTNFARVYSDIGTAVGAEAALGFLHSVSPRTGLFGEVNYSYLPTGGKNATVTIQGQVINDDEIIDARWLTVRGGITVFLGGK